MASAILACSLCYEILVFILNASGEVKNTVLNEGERG